MQCSVTGVYLRIIHELGRNPLLQGPRHRRCLPTNQRRSGTSAQEVEALTLMWDTRNQTLNTTMGIYQHGKVKVRKKSTEIKYDRITTVSSLVATLQHKQRKVQDGFLFQTFQPLHKTEQGDSLRPFSITTITMVGFKP